MDAGDYSTPGSDVSEHTGFPNPATDNSLQGLQLTKLLVKNPSSTFFFRIEGNDWQDQGIFDGDIAVIDRAVASKKVDKVIWSHEDSFQISELHKVPETAEVWGTVTAIIHMYHGNSR